MSLIKLFKKYIRSTPAKVAVVEQVVLVCVLTKVVKLSGSFKSRKVYINTKVLKHLYDSKPAEEFEFIIRHLPQIVKFPNHIYENKGSKRGGICFTKKVQGNNYICSLEITDDTDPDGDVNGMNYVATCFRIRKDSYLKNYKLLWSWKGDEPSS